MSAIKSTQNRSSAVMQQRTEPHDSLDDFPTPPWATRALCEYVLGSCKVEENTVWEPACNRGYMAKPLAEYFKSVDCSDIHDYGWEGQSSIFDFLFADSTKSHDWVITNPPFRLADQFINKALEIANIGVAVIVRSAFLEGKGRYEELFSKNPPSKIAQFVERVPMCKGKYDPDISSATAYSWIVWEHCSNTTEFLWIPPCRKLLEKPEDAPVKAIKLVEIDENQGAMEI